MQIRRFILAAAIIAITIPLFMWGNRRYKLATLPEPAAAWVVITPKDAVDGSKPGFVEIWASDISGKKKWRAYRQKVLGNDPQTQSLMYKYKIPYNAYIISGKIPLSFTLYESVRISANYSSGQPLSGMRLYMIYLKQLLGLFPNWDIRECDLRTGQVKRITSVDYIWDSYIPSSPTIKDIALLMEYDYDYSIQAGVAVKFSISQTSKLGSKYAEFSISAEIQNAVYNDIYISAASIGKDEIAIAYELRSYGSGQWFNNMSSQRIVFYDKNTSQELSAFHLDLADCNDFPYPIAVPVGKQLSFQANAPVKYTSSSIDIIAPKPGSKLWLAVVDFEAETNENSDARGSDRRKASTVLVEINPHNGESRHVAFGEHAIGMPNHRIREMIYDHKHDRLYFVVTNVARPRGKILVLDDNENVEFITQVAGQYESIRVAADGALWFIGRNQDRNNTENADTLFRHDFASGETEVVAIGPRILGVNTAAY